MIPAEKVDAETLQAAVTGHRPGSLKFPSSTCSPGHPIIAPPFTVVSYPPHHTA